MSTTDHWMRLHIGDYLADTPHLSTFQHGIYLLLIMAYFKRRGLPDDEAELARISRVTRVQFRKLSGPVLAMFEKHAGRLLHRRIELELARAEGISGVRKDAAGKRWANANAHASASQGRDTATGKSADDSRAGGGARSVPKREPRPRKNLPPNPPPEGRGTQAHESNGADKQASTERRGRMTALGDLLPHPAVVPFKQRRSE